MMFIGQRPENDYAARKKCTGRILLDNKNDRQLQPRQPRKDQRKKRTRNEKQQDAQSNDEEGSGRKQEEVRSADDDGGRKYSKIGLESSSLF